MMRWIMHVDMDAFFASVEQLDNPAYRGLPVIVGGNSVRGVVSTCSYEARRFGVRSAMSSVMAYRLCPQGIFVQGRMWRYKEVSQQIMSIFHEFSPQVEPLSIDEAFLDLTGMEHLVGDVPALGQQIKDRIHAVTGLTASVGLAPNKFLAKLASDLRKPDGLVIIRQEEAADFIAPLPIGKIFGIGKQAEQALHKLGVITIGQLAACDTAYLAKALGNNAGVVKQLAQGLDDRPVVSDREAKSIGRETTYDFDLQHQREIQAGLGALCQQVGYRVRGEGVAGHTVTLKVKFNDFQSITRSFSTERAISLDEDIEDIVRQLTTKVKWNKPVRLLGVYVSKLEPSGAVLLEEADDTRNKKRTQVLDALKDKYGESIIKRGL